MSLTNLEIVGVMRRSDLDHTGAKLRIDEIIGHNSDFPIENRQDGSFADVFLIAFIFGIDCQCGVTQHCLRPGSGADQVLILTFELVFDIPEMGILALVFNFIIRQRGLATGAPIDNIAPAVD